MSGGISELCYPRMNETYIDRFVQTTFYKGIAALSRRQDKLLLACQYLANRSSRIRQPHLYITAKRMTSMKLIVCSCIFFPVRRFLFINCVPRRDVGDRIFVTFSCYACLNKQFRGGTRAAILPFIPRGRAAIYYIRTSF